MKQRPIEAIYLFLHVESAIEMHHAYVRHDQPLFESKAWDYDNPDLVTNKVKEMLLALDPTDLSEEEDEWRRVILWFWFHHAISCALWKKDLQAALRYSETAAALNNNSNENQITTWLYLMVRGRYFEAKKLLNSMGPDKESAESLEEEVLVTVRTLK